MEFEKEKEDLGFEKFKNRAKLSTLGFWEVEFWF
jgi:hypothetical protein